MVIHARLGQKLDTSKVPPSYHRRPTATDLAFPFQQTDGVHNEAPIEMTIPADNKMLPQTPIQSLQPVASNSGVQKWLVGQTVVNPAEGTQRSRHPARLKNINTGSYGYTFEDGVSQYLPEWPVRGTESSRPLPLPWERSRRVTKRVQKTNFPEVSYNRSMSYQTGIGSPFKPLPFL